MRSAPLWLAVMLLAGCDGKSLSGPGPNDSHCDGMPVPGTVSFWVECSSPSVGPSVDCLHAWVPLILTNDGPVPVFLDWPCGINDWDMFAVQPDGSRVLEPPCIVPDCINDPPPWFRLLPGQTLELTPIVTSYGPHVSTLRVGFGCRDALPGDYVDFSLCDSTQLLATPEFTIVP